MLFVVHIFTIKAIYYILNWLIWELVISNSAYSATATSPSDGRCNTDLRFNRMLLSIDHSQCGWRNCDGMMTISLTCKWCGACAAITSHTDVTCVLRHTCVTSLGNTSSSTGHRHATRINDRQCCLFCNPSKSLHYLKKITTGYPLCDVSVTVIWQCIF